MEEPEVEAVLPTAEGREREGIVRRQSTFEATITTYVGQLQGAEATNRKTHRFLLRFIKNVSEEALQQPLTMALLSKLYNESVKPDGFISQDFERSKADTVAAGVKSFINFCTYVAG